MKIKSVIVFTEQDYATLNKACMLLDDLIHGDEYQTVFSEIVGEITDLNEFYNIFATLTDYAEEHRE